MQLADPLGARQPDLDRKLSLCQALADGVITAALQDYSGRDPEGNARVFLFDEGVWGKVRRYWCRMLGVEEGLVTKLAQEIEGKRIRLKHYVWEGVNKDEETASSDGFGDDDGLRDDGDFTDDPDVAGPGERGFRQSPIFFGWSRQRCRSKAV